MKHKNKKIRALIAEDEPLARQTLRDFLAEFDWLEIVGEASDGVTAARLIDELRPALVFLDVRMPELSGVEVLRRAAHRPAIVFTTAFDDYAVTAFEFEALDYLQKPFGRERFRRTIERVRRRLFNQEFAADDKKTPPAAVENAPLARLFVRDRGRILPLSVEEIVRLEAADDYTTIHAVGKQFLVGVTLGEFERRLDSNRFLRIHRSAIINLDCISQIEEDARRLLVHMTDGATVQASRTGAQILKQFIT